MRSTSEGPSCTAAHQSSAPVRRRLRAIVAVLAGFTLTLAACSSGSGSDAATDTTAKRTTSTSTATTTTTDPAEAEDLLAQRPVEVHVPPNYEEGTPAPLLILLHGFGAGGQIQEAYFSLTKPADAAGMLYVQPDGTTNARGKQFWNATDACCAGPGSNVDDAAYLKAVIDSVSADYDVDPKRIFLVGHSNGGFMAYRMACDHADTVAAVVSVAGATNADTDACDPSEPVPTLEIHGRSDTTILYDGGKTALGSYPSAPETVETWAAYNGCATTPDAESTPATRDLVQDLPPAVVTTYSEGCDPGGHAELWSQDEGVHIPAWSPTFPQQVIDWLQEHPKT